MILLIAVYLTGIVLAWHINSAVDNLMFQKECNRWRADIGLDQKPVKLSFVRRK